MTDQVDLNRVLGAFLAGGTDELADRVIDAALDQIDHTPQRHALRLPWRFPTMTLYTRLAAAAVIGVIAVGGALYVIRPSLPGIGAASPTPGSTSISTGPPATPTSPPPTLQPAGAMVDERQIHTATLLRDGRVFITGGYMNVEVPNASVEVYDPTARAFTRAGTMSTPRGLHTATLLADGRVLIAGGGPASWAVDAPYLALAEIFDPVTGTLTTTDSMTSPREDHTATLLQDGRVLITGGNDVGDRGVASAELYDPATGTFTATGSMTTPRGFHTATLLSDGRVLITGGDRHAWSDTGPYLASAELFDPRTGTFTATGDMSVGRSYHSAVLLADGRVLVLGGVTYGGDNGSLASAEIYDPATGKFTATGSLADPRVYLTATTLTDGRVLVTGGLANGRVYGSNPEFLASAEIYDPRTGVFSATGSMIARRGWAAATLLGDGRVLVTGGATDGGSDSLSSAEIYDPATGAFGPVT